MRRIGYLFAATRTFLPYSRLHPRRMGQPEEKPIKASVKQSSATRCASYEVGWGLKMKLKLYLDTSVFSAYLDDRAPDRRAQTVEFWERLTVFDACTSELAREEWREHRLPIAGPVSPAIAGWSHGAPNYSGDEGIVRTICSGRSVHSDYDERRRACRRSGSYPAGHIVVLEFQASSESRSPCED